MYTELDQLKEQVRTIQVRIEELEKECKEEEVWPQVGDKYWYVRSTGSIGAHPFEDDATDSSLASTGNVHRTKEEAEAYRDWLQSPRVQARRKVEMCEGVTSFGFYSICVRKDDGLLQIEEQNDQWSDGSINFDSQASAQACLDKLGEDTIKTALGVE